MGTIADKLNYLNTTKENIKSAIVAKGVSVSDSDTFRSYADKIADIEPTLGTKTITANGTYTATDDSLNGYSEVTVDIDDTDLYRDTTDSTYESVKTLSNCGAFPMLSLKVGIEPIQEGSGDPSPTNIRPISGHTEANVVVSPTTDAEDGTTYTIQFKDGSNPLTVYGGTLDVVSGELVVDRAMVDLGSLTWLNNALKTNAFEAYVTTSLVKPYTANLISNALVQKSSFEDVAEYTFRMGDNFLAVKVPKSVATNGTQVKQWLTDNAVTLCYELATPQTIQLTPTQVKSLLGTNNLWADTGDVGDVRYFKKVEL